MTEEISSFDSLNVDRMIKHVEFKVPLLCWLFSCREGSHDSESSTSSCVSFSCSRASALDRAKVGLTFECSLKDWCLKHLTPQHELGPFRSTNHSKQYNTSTVIRRGCEMRDQRWCSIGLLLKHGNSSEPAAILMRIKLIVKHMLAKVSKIGEIVRTQYWRFPGFHWGWWLVLLLHVVHACMM